MGSLHSYMLYSVKLELEQRDSYYLLRFKEVLEVSHLPHTNDNEDECLSEAPPQNAGIGRLTGVPESFLPYLQGGTRQD